MFAAKLRGLGVPAFCANGFSVMSKSAWRWIWLLGSGAAVVERLLSPAPQALPGSLVAVTGPEMQALLVKAAVEVAPEATSLVMGVLMTRWIGWPAFARLAMVQA